MSFKKAQTGESVPVFHNKTNSSVRLSWISLRETDLDAGVTVWHTTTASVRWCEESIHSNEVEL